MHYDDQISRAEQCSTCFLNGSLPGNCCVCELIATNNHRRVVLLFSFMTESSPELEDYRHMIRGQHYASAAVALTAIWLITVLGGSTRALRSAYPFSFSLPCIFLHRPVVTYQGKVRTLIALHILVCAQMHALRMTCNDLWCRGNQGQFCFKGVVRVIHACTELAIHFSRRQLALKVCES